MATWEGMKVRNKDGRRGEITSEYGLGDRFLTISVEGGKDAEVELRLIGSDSGEPGWEWWCEHFDGGPRWLPLTDHKS